MLLINLMCLDVCTVCMCVLMYTGLTFELAMSGPSSSSASSATSKLHSCICMYVLTLIKFSAFLL